MKKKKGLLVWFEMDRRIELLQPFIDISDDIEFIHLHFRTREERNADISPFEVIYWFDYSSPYELIKAHKPDFIVGATEGLLSIALIVAAKEKGIPYYGLQHGFTTENLLDIIVNEKRTFADTFKKIGMHHKTLRFYFSAIPASQLSQFPKFLKLFYLFFKNFPEAALAKAGYSFPKPKYYICFSEISAAHYKSLYNLSPGELKYVGILSFDQLFLQLAKHQERKFKKHFLMIDTAFTDYYKEITDDQMNRCYQELKKYCMANDAVLVVKLHPHMYQKSTLQEDEHLKVVRNLPMDELAGYIKNAEGCFGFYSTLTMPTAFVVPTIQIRYDEVYEPLLVKKGVTPLVDFFTFKAEELIFNSLENKAELTREFLFATDGCAAKRVKEILIGQ